MEFAGESNSSVSNENQEEMVFNPEYGQILSENYPIAEAILRHMNVRQLNTCAQVCKTWASIARKLKKEKQEIFWVFQVVHHEDVGINSHLDPVDNQEKFYATNIQSDVGDAYNDVCDNAPSEPSLGLLFCTDIFYNKMKNYFWEYLDYWDEKRKELKRKKRSGESIISTRFTYETEATEFLASKLPETCRVLCCASSGVVGTPIDNSPPVEAESSIGISGVFFPSMAGVQLYPFSITENEQNQFKKNKSTYDSAKIAEITGIPEDSNIKSFLFFVHEPVRNRLTGHILDHYLDNQKQNLALGGAIMDEISAPVNPTDKSWPYATGLAICGDNVQAASVVLSPKVKTRQKAEDCISKLANCGFKKENCIAFMFACCGRGDDHYQEPNVEAEAFHKFFPKVPLFGVFGNGEIGIESLPEDGTAEKKTKFPKYDCKVKKLVYCHAYTTIIVLVCLPK